LHTQANGTDGSISDCMLPNGVRSTVTLGFQQLLSYRVSIATPNGAGDPAHEES
jgi:hypothetical protein